MSHFTRTFENQHSARMIFWDEIPSTKQIQLTMWQNIQCHFGIQLNPRICIMLVTWLWERYTISLTLASWSYNRNKYTTPWEWQGDKRCVFQVCGLIPVSLLVLTGKTMVAMITIITSFLQSLQDTKLSSYLLLTALSVTRSIGLSVT